MKVVSTFERWSVPWSGAECEPTFPGCGLSGQLLDRVGLAGFSAEEGTGCKSNALLLSAAQGGSQKELATVHRYGASIVNCPLQKI